MRLRKVKPRRRNDALAVECNSGYSAGGAHVLSCLELLSAPRSVVAPLCRPPVRPFDWRAVPESTDTNVNATSTATAFNGADGAVGLGVDIVEIERMRKILKRSPAFSRKVFSREECCYCDATAAPEIHYATRFAAKEAVLKALGTGFSEGISVRDVEVKRTSKGRPFAVLTGRAKEVAKEMGVRELPLSLSYTHTEAVACAMAITDGSMRATEQRRDPMEELSRQFKEARAMLDDLEVAPAPAPLQVPSAMAAMDMVAATDGESRAGKMDDANGATISTAE